MSRRAAILVVLPAVLVLLLAGALPRPWFPLGVRGEWEWSRHGAAVDAGSLAIGILAALGYVALGVAGFVDLRRGRSRVRTLGWLAALVAGGIGVQVGIQTSAPAGMGLTKWTTLGMSGSSGYYLIARELPPSPRAFLAAYPEWITRQDALHIGTHPPGLIVLAHGVQRLTRGNPSTAGRLDAALPREIVQGFRAILGSVPAPDRVAMVLIGAGTLAGCVLVVLPLYALARTGLAPCWAWGVAALWPLTPGAILFQPTADTWFPLLSTAALALAAREGRDGRAGGVAAGVVLAVGMQFSLVFLAVGLVVAMMVVAGRGRPAAGRRWLVLAGPVVRLGWIGLGFLAATLAWWAATSADPFAIWMSNARNHARFYVQFPRSRWPWCVANLVETIVAIGVPTAVGCAAGLFGLAARGDCGASRPSVRTPMMAAALATLFVLATLTISGRSLSEVGRLWLPLFPALLTPCGHAWERLRAGWPVVGLTLALLAAETIVLQAVIQVVYPVV